MKELNKIIDDMTSVIRKINRTIITLMAVLLLSIIIRNGLILMVFVIMSILYIFVLVHKIVSFIEKYVREYHLEEFKKYQKDNLFLSMSHQRYSLFLKSEYFKIHNKDEETLIRTFNIYTKVSTRILIVIFLSFAASIFLSI